MKSEEIKRNININLMTVFQYISNYKV